MEDVLCNIIKIALSNGCEGVRGIVEDYIRDCVDSGMVVRADRLRNILDTMPAKASSQEFIPRRVGTVCPKDSNLVVDGHFCRHICRDRVKTKLFTSIPSDICPCNFKSE